MNMKNNTADLQGNDMNQKESILLTIGYNLRGLLSMLLLYANTLRLFGPLMAVAIL